MFQLQVDNKERRGGSRGSKYSGCCLVHDVETANQHHDPDSTLYLSSVRNMHGRHKGQGKHDMPPLLLNGRFSPDLNYCRSIFLHFRQLSVCPFSSLVHVHATFFCLLMKSPGLRRGIVCFNSCCCGLSGPAAEPTGLMTGTWTSTSTARTSTPAGKAVESLSHAVSKTRQ